MSFGEGRAALAPRTSARFGPAAGAAGGARAVVQLSPSYTGNATPSNSYNLGNERGSGSDEELRAMVNELISDAGSLKKLSKKVVKGGMKMAVNFGADYAERKAGVTMIKFGEAFEADARQYIKAGKTALDKFEEIKGKLDELAGVVEVVQDIRRVFSRGATRAFIDDPSIDNARLLATDVSAALATANRFVPDIPFVGDYLSGVLGAPERYLSKVLDIYDEYLEKIDAAADIASGHTVEVLGIGTMTGPASRLFLLAWKRHPGGSYGGGLARFIYEHRYTDGVPLEMLTRSQVIDRLIGLLEDHDDSRAGTWRDFLRDL